MGRNPLFANGYFALIAVTQISHHCKFGLLYLAEYYTQTLFVGIMYTLTDGV